MQVSVILTPPLAPLHLSGAAGEESHGILRLERQPQDDDKGKKLAHGVEKYMSGAS